MALSSTKNLPITEVRPAGRHDGAGVARPYPDPMPSSSHPARSDLPTSRRSLLSMLKSSSPVLKLRMMLKESAGVGLQPVDYLDEALALCRQRRRRFPGAQLYSALENQLNYLRGLVVGKLTDRSRLRDIALDRFANGGIDGVDAVFARALKNAAHIGHRLEGDLPLDTQGLRRAARRVR